MRKDDQRWEYILGLLLEYIQTYHRFPIFREVYKDVNLDRWLRSQQEAYRGGFIPQNRKEMLDQAIPEWNQPIRRRELNEKYLLKERIFQDDETPLHTFLSGEELLQNLSHDVYTCKQWLEQNAKFSSFRNGWKVFQGYQQLHLRAQSNYSYLLATSFLTKEEMTNFHAVNEFLAQLPFDCTETMICTIEEVIGKDSICLQCVQMRYAISCDVPMTLDAIGNALGLNKGQVSTKLIKAQRHLRKSRLLEKENKNSIDNLHLSTRAMNGLLRNGITEIPQLLQLNEEDLLSIRNIGIGTVDEIIEKVEAYTKSSNKHIYRSICEQIVAFGDENACKSTEEE